MIEVEIKLSLSENEIQKLKNLSVCLKTISFTDTYYDDEECSLTSSNIWLRKRDRRFELKIGPSKIARTDIYQEIADEEQIKNILELKGDTLAYALKAAQIHPFLSFVNRREKYRLDNISVDLDIADLDDLSYSIVEFEILAHQKEDIMLAQKQIDEKLKELQIIARKKPLPKVAYFLLKKRPEHFQRLIDAKVISY